MEEEMWLARDENENLHLHDTKPRKDTRRGMWISLELCHYLIYPDKFPEVQWSDNEPTKVKLTIEK